MRSESSARGMAGLEVEEEMEGARRQKFFKILLPGTFESTLCLPPKFAARLAGCPAAATLSDPAGKSWDVEVARCGGRNQQAPCFAGTGWRAFVRANRLAPGHMLLFDHRGGLHFAVDLFDQSGCLKEEEDDDDLDDDMESGNAGAWRRAFGGGMKKKKKKTKRKRSRSPPAAAADTCEQVQIARPYQLRFLDLSKSMCERMGWTSSRDAELVNSIDKDKDDGRRWPVSVKVSGKGGMICGGWSAFANDNHLRLNDTCVFFVKSPPPPPSRLHQFQVHILRSTTAGRTHSSIVNSSYVHTYVSTR